MTESEQLAHLKQRLTERLTKKGYFPDRINSMFDTYISVLRTFSVQEIKDFFNTLFDIADMEDTDATKS